MSSLAFAADSSEPFIISSRSFTAERIGFQANFVRIRKNKRKISTDQKSVPTAGVVRLFANNIIYVILTIQIFNEALQPTAAALQIFFAESHCMVVLQKSNYNCEQSNSLDKGS